jgi:hypothetical protein
MRTRHCLRVAAYANAQRFAFSAQKSCLSSNVAQMDFLVKAQNLDHRLKCLFLVPSGYVKIAIENGHL